MKRYAAIETGGTKVNLAIGSGPDDLTEILRIPTRTPEPTVADILDGLRQLHNAHGPFEGIGIASFGPIDVNPKSPAYGQFRKTPKPGWSHFDLLNPIRAAWPDMPVIIDTDVNGAGLGEGRWGGAQGLDSFAYVTVGTGLGVGLILNGRPVHGLLHPEAGHVRVRRHPDDTYAGNCPFHGDCVEGLVCGPAIAERTGRKGETIPADDPVWSLVGYYLGQLFHSLTLIASPQRILVGGGVGLNAQVLASARDEAHRLLKGYLEALVDRAVYDTYIQPAQLGDRAGVLGAIALSINTL